jgi:hypothetical protein
MIEYRFASVPKLGENVHSTIEQSAFLTLQLQVPGLHCCISFKIASSTIRSNEMHNGHAARTIILLGVLVALSGCNKTGTSSATTSSTNSSATANSSGQTDAATGTSSQAAAPAPAATPAPAPVVIPAGKTLAVTIDQNISTKDNSTGDGFEASLAEPLTVDGNEVLRRGTHLRGTVTESDEAGHVKGAATLAITLSAINSNGQTYEIHTDSYSVQGKARGKRTGIGTGGGAAFGAIIGALAGGGKGAAIGAAAGGGAGAAGAAYTGDRDVSIPAERLVHFRLTRSVTLSQ